MLRYVLIAAVLLYLVVLGFAGTPGTTDMGAFEYPQGGAGSIKLKLDGAHKKRNNQGSWWRW